MKLKTLSAKTIFNDWNTQKHTLTLACQVNAKILFRSPGPAKRTSYPDEWTAVQMQQGTQELVKLV